MKILALITALILSGCSTQYSRHSEEAPTRMLIPVPKTGASVSIFCFIAYCKVDHYYLDPDHDDLEEDVTDGETVPEEEV